MENNSRKPHSVDLTQQICVLNDGEVVPVSECFQNDVGQVVSVVAGPTRDGVWLAVELIENEKETYH